MVAREDHHTASSLPTERTASLLVAGETDETQNVVKHYSPSKCEALKATHDEVFQSQAPAPEEEKVPHNIVACAGATARAQRVTIAARTQGTQRRRRECARSRDCAGGVARDVGAQAARRLSPSIWLPAVSAPGPTLLLTIATQQQGLQEVVPRERCTHGRGALLRDTTPPPGGRDCEATGGAM